MIKIFERDDKINFVDDNNVFVGFDYRACCCECFGYIISEKIDAEIEEKEHDLSEYRFDTNYFKGIPCKEEDEEIWESTNAVVFKMIAENKPDLFLKLHNTHNGYYGHGFEAKIGGLNWQEGCL
jgi:hypothetical protein